MIPRRELVFHVAELDRPLALTEAIMRALRRGYHDLCVRGCERIEDPASGDHVWRISLTARRPRKEKHKHHEVPR